jgi:L-asparaginase
MAYQGASGDLIRTAVDRGADGVVIAGAGAGSTSAGQRDAIAYASEKGVSVVMTSRTGGGRIAPQRISTEPEENPATRAESRRPRRIAGEDLAPVKARVLLMLALTVSDDRDVIQRMFSEY